MSRRPDPGVWGRFLDDLADPVEDAHLVEHETGAGVEEQDDAVPRRRQHLHVGAVGEQVPGVLEPGGGTDGSVGVPAEGVPGADGTCGVLYRQGRTVADDPGASMARPWLACTTNQRAMSLALETTPPSPASKVPGPSTANAWLHPTTWPSARRGTGSSSESTVTDRAHAGGSEDVVLKVGREVLARDDLDESRSHLVVGVVVVPRGARRRHEPGVERVLRRPRGAMPGCGPSSGCTVESARPEVCSNS